MLSSKFLSILDFGMNLIPYPVLNVKKPDKFETPETFGDRKNDVHSLMSYDTQYNNREMEYSIDHNYSSYDSSL